MSADHRAVTPSVSIEEVSKAWEGTAAGSLALDNVSLVLDDDEFLSIVGPSGCGKTTLLNMVAGIVKPTSGRVLVRDHARGDIGYVTQKDSLLMWRTLLGNVELGLELRGVPRAERQRRAKELIDLVGLRGFEERFPDQLSGGMRQRASLIRTLLYDPKLLLLDEPFGSLDALTRVALQAELIKLWERTHLPTILVTHDISEAICVSDRVVLMTARPGRVGGEYRVTLPRPRRSPIELWKTEEFRKTFDVVWEDLRVEIERASA
jgi:NitT/TauT family transport system ATP-binding protein